MFPLISLDRICEMCKYWKNFHCRKFIIRKNSYSTCKNRNTFSS